jgi:exopolysaccharide biosynthesis polyprenyl glycosylphosphotransferase
MTAFVNELCDVLDERTLGILRGHRAIPLGRRRGWLVRRALVCADITGLIVAFALAEGLSLLHVHQDSGLDRLTELAFFLASLPFWILAAKLYRLYDRDEERTDHSTADDLSRVFHLVTVCSFLLYAGAQATRWISPQFLKLFTFWLFATVAVTFLRGAARWYCRRQISYLQNTVIVGAGTVGQSVARKFLSHPEYGINLVGFVDANPMEREEGLAHLVILGDTEALPELIDLLDIERVIFAFSRDDHELALGLIRRLSNMNVQVDIVPRFFDVLSPAMDIHDVEGVPVLGLRPARLPMSSRILKRSADVIGAAVGLTLLSPLFVAIAIALRLDSRGPVFFRQVRVGAAGQAFSIWKFRTMLVDAEVRKHELAHLNKHHGDPRMFKIDDDPRVTPVGRWLRRHSFDELPQLINVLHGEMSLVGPRPLIPDEHCFVNDWATKRLELRPGITGLWQVMGRDGIDFGDMVKLDYRYVTSWSVGEDLRLMLRTLPLVLSRKARKSDAVIVDSHKGRYGSPLPSETLRAN